MAGRMGAATVSAVALAAATAKTAVQLVSANIAFKLIQLIVTFDGNSNTAVPVLVELVRQSDAGTSNALATVKADDSIGDALDTQARETITVEPATGDVLRAWYVHPQTGFDSQLHDLAPILVGITDRIGVRLTAPAVVNATVSVLFEE